MPQVFCMLFFFATCVLCCFDHLGFACVSFHLGTGSAWPRERQAGQSSGVGDDQPPEGRDGAGGGGEAEGEEGEGAAEAVRKAPDSNDGNPNRSDRNR